MPFGLKIHMAAAHGPNSASRQLRFSQEANETVSIGGKRHHAKRRPGKPSGKKMPIRHPRPKRY
jgi:hypothetical protein